jgi:hypothetical protein
MKLRHVILGFAVVVLVGTGIAAYHLGYLPGLSIQGRPIPRFTASEGLGEVVLSEEYRLSGPYTYDNLTVFLVHGRETLDGRSILTLPEAIEQKKAVVHETENVNQLSIENLASGEEVYVLSGDVVKGGKQDRTLPYDAIVGARSGRVSIDSFCVESGRWAKRGDEEASTFGYVGSNTGKVGSLKSAPTSGKGGQAQAGVWQSVAQTQAALSKKLGEPVQAEASKSSLQLTLENPKVRGAIAPYVSALSALLEKRDDVIGLVVVVNGRIHSADVFASRDLFRKLYPRLLEGSAIEAFIESESGKTFAAVSEKDVRAFLADAESQEPTDEAATDRTYVQTRQTKDTTLQESCDRSRNNLVLHRSFVRRE